MESEGLRSLSATFVSCHSGGSNILNLVHEVNYTFTKSWRSYIFTSVCLSLYVCVCVCVCVCLCVCVSNSTCEQNSSRTDEPIWTRFSLNGCLAHWLGPFILVTLGQRSRSQWLNIHFFFIILC